MVTEEDCSCTDTTDPSNVTSVDSDNRAAAENANENATTAHVETTEKKDEKKDAAEEPKST